MIIGGSKKLVIENIKRNITDGNLNNKVEVNDAVLTEEEIKNYIKKFYENKDKKSYLVKNKMANDTVKKFGKLMYPKIEIVGLDNLDKLDLSHGAIITSNHFNPLDSYNVRKIVEMKLHRKLYLVIQDTNLAMPDNFGFLMNNLDVIPLTKSPNYINNIFIDELEKILSNGDIVLIYPEEEMWFNYRKPRPCKRGAYWFATMLKVPVISCFTEIISLDTKDNEEFYDVRYKIHVLKPILMDNKISLKANSIEMANRDYKQKKECYEECYHKKLDYTFRDDDIAGWIKND